MIRQVELSSDLTLAQCQAKMMGIESRIGEVVDSVADSGDNQGEAAEVTVVSANKWSHPPANSLILVREGDAAPDGATLSIAGMAWIEEEKVVIKVYRKAP